LFKIPDKRNPITAKIAKVMQSAQRIIKNLHRVAQRFLKSYSRVCALSTEPCAISGEIYFIVKMIIVMIFEHIISCNRLNLEAYFVFKIPFSVDGDQALLKI
jgi:hypothetical protein